MKKYSRCVKKYSKGAGCVNKSSKGVGCVKQSSKGAVDQFSHGFECVIKSGQKASDVCKGFIKAANQIGAVN